MMNHVLLKIKNIFKENAKSSEIDVLSFEKISILKAILKINKKTSN